MVLDFQGIGNPWIFNVPSKHKLHPEKKHLPHMRHIWCLWPFARLPSGPVSWETETTATFCDAEIWSPKHSLGICETWWNLVFHLCLILDYYECLWIIYLLYTIVPPPLDVGPHHQVASQKRVCTCPGSIWKLCLKRNVFCYVVVDTQWLHTYNIDTYSV